MALDDHLHAELVFEFRVSLDDLGVDRVGGNFRGVLTAVTVLFAGDDGHRGVMNAVESVVDDFLTVFVILFFFFGICLLFLLFRFFVTFFRLIAAKRYPPRYLFDFVRFPSGNGKVKKSIFDASPSAKPSSYFEKIIGYGLHFRQKVLQWKTNRLPPIENGNG